MSHIPGALNVAPNPGSRCPCTSPTWPRSGGSWAATRAEPLVLYCNGPFCGKSKRLSEELLAAGYTNVRRYQLGIPVWRALVGLTEIELDGVASRPQARPHGGLPRRTQRGGVRRRQHAGGPEHPADVAGTRQGRGRGEDGEGRRRLPMEDHNTRIVVFGRDADQARAVAAAIAREAFHNVAYVPGTDDALRAALK